METNEKTLEEQMLEAKQKLMDKIKGEDDPEKLINLIKSYETINKLITEDWQKARELDLRDKEIKANFWATILSAVLSQLVANTIKVIGGNHYQMNWIRAEAGDLYVKPNKFIPPYK